MIRLSLLNIVIKPKKFHLLLILSVWCFIVILLAINSNRKTELLQRSAIDLPISSQTNGDIDDDKRLSASNSAQVVKKTHDNNNQNPSEEALDKQPKSVVNNEKKNVAQAIFPMFAPVNPNRPSLNSNFYPSQSSSSFDPLNVMRGRRSSSASSSANFHNMIDRLNMRVLILIIVNEEKSNSIEQRNSNNNNLHISRNVKLIIDTLESDHIDFTIDSTRNGMPNSLLASHSSIDGHDKAGLQYPVIIIDDLLKYATLNRWLKDQLDRHCRTHNIGIIAFFDFKNPPNSRWQHSDKSSTLIEGFPLYYRRVSELQLHDYRLNSRSAIPRILKTNPDLVMQGCVSPNIDHSPWFAMFSDHPTYESVSYARLVAKTTRDRQSATSNFTSKRKRTDSLSRAKSNKYSHGDTIKRRQSKRAATTHKTRYINLDYSRESNEIEISNNSSATLSNTNDIYSGNVMVDLATLVMADHGLYDGIRRVIFGGGINFWYHRALLLDAVGHLSNGKIISSLDRYIQIDIDDIFVGEVGTRMKLDDVEELIEAQRQFGLVIDGGFKFNLGYSGKYFLRGDELEDEGDRLLIKSANEFNWFCHSWSHSKAHLSDDSSRIERELMLNQQFGKRYNLPIIQINNSNEEESLHASSGFRYHHQPSNRLGTPTRLEQALAQNYDSTHESDEYIETGNGKKVNELGSDAETSSSQFTSSSVKSIILSDLAHYGGDYSPSIDVDTASQQHSNKSMPKITGTSNNSNDRKINTMVDLSQQQRQHEKKQQKEAIRPSGTYSVAPHHSGVFPIHEPLYEAWRKVLNVQVTTTEEYPHLRPAKLRRGFIYKDIMVLPRQTCGLYTHTIFMDKYPGGKQKLDASIQGGELFQTILHNPVSVFMTHLSNYGNDRLALYTFSSLINFIMKWTNINLRSSSNPMDLAKYYFASRPDEVDPIWSNPCHDKRHVSIWNRGEKWCKRDRLPRFLIVGPQKTGTTALHTFLQLVPNLKTSRVDKTTTFEEPQFFNSRNYLRGLDWYIDLFTAAAHDSNNDVNNSNNTNDNNNETSRATWPGNHDNNNNNNNSDTPESDNSFSTAGSHDDSYYFEKSATYFDDASVPRRAFALLPKGKIVIMLISPIDRAYSWYQHMRAHGDKIAAMFTFYQIITATDSRAPKRLLQLRSRCLTPGHYAQHLQRWLAYYPAEQVIVIDGHWFRQNPSSVINRLLAIVNIPPVIDFNKLLVFDKKKGFFCQAIQDQDNNTNVSRSDLDRKHRRHHDHRKESGQDKSVNERNDAADETPQHASHKRANHPITLTKCLGKSKGRKYPPMDAESRFYLRRYYMAHNRQLANLLSNELKQPLPNWLEDEISFG